MAHPNRPRSRSMEAKRRRPRFRYRVEAVQALEERQLLAPFLSSNAIDVTVTQPDPNANIFDVDLTQGAALANSAAPFVSVSQLTPLSTFGDETVRIEAGPGGDFGNVLYAITRGDNVGAPPITTDGRPGVIYRVDPATGDASVFFDLNTVLDQVSPGTTAENSAGVQTGLVNWYDIAFDPDGIFDGLPSMFVASVDRSNPLKNTIYRIAPDGTFLGLFTVFDDDQGTAGLVRRPSAIEIPPPQQQDFLRGMFVGSGTNAGNPDPPGQDNPTFSALFFDSNEFQSGQPVGDTLPNGVSFTNLDLGPQVGIASANNNYNSRVFSAFTDFGRPGIPDFSPPLPGLSGIQGLGGEELIGAQVTGRTVDADPTTTTPFRRFQDIAFDEFGFFSFGTTVTPGGPGALPTIGAPVFSGSVFVADLATGLEAELTPVDPLPDDPIDVPIQGPGSVELIEDPITGAVVPQITNGNTTGGSNIGGRVVRVLPDGTVTPFAEGFNTSGRQDSGSFVESSLSLTFSADGTTLYVADNDGIWQFKTTMSLAGSTAGSAVGLNDIRTLGRTFDGSDTAVAVIDTGVDAQTPQLRGRVAEGINLFTGGPGDDDLAPGNGHGTLVAGVVAQFVPQTTLVPVNTFDPLGTNTTNQTIFDAFRYVADNPFVIDPVRPGVLDRVVASTIGFGTVPDADGDGTFQTEGIAFRQFPQLVLAFKNQLSRIRNTGITTVAAAGQFGDVNTGAGAVNGEALPAILNETVSVSGTYPFPFATGPTSPPTDPPIGPFGRFFAPFALTSDGVTLPPITAGDNTIFLDRLLGAANRSHTTDFVAPAIDVPTFGRTFDGDNDTNNIFDATGTSLSAGIQAGSVAMLASALEFFSELAVTGSTVNAFMTTPVGSQPLDFGVGTIRSLEAFANPDGINSILQWTAVPAEDADLPGDDNVQQPHSLARPARFRQFSRVDVGNAIAAIEGSVALSYLFTTGTITAIDANGNSFITAQELENFVDQAETIGLPEAGAMARLLGGTDRVPGNQPIDGPRDFITVPESDPILTPIATLGLTSQNEQPDQPDVLQRRFNFFDFSADGQLDGMVSIAQFEMLAHTLLPAPDSFSIVNQARGSAGGFLLDGDPVRNFADLQRLLPTFAFLPRQLALRFRNFSPAKFGINRGVPAGQGSPGFGLFQVGPGEGFTAVSDTSSVARPRPTPRPQTSNPNSTNESPATPRTRTPAPRPTLPSRLQALLGSVSGRSRGINLTTGDPLLANSTDSEDDGGRISPARQEIIDRILERLVPTTESDSDAEDTTSDGDGQATA